MLYGTLKIHFRGIRTAGKTKLESFCGERWWQTGQDVVMGAVKGLSLDMFQRRNEKDSVMD
jgi:hypothetical protein